MRARHLGPVALAAAVLLSTTVGVPLLAPGVASAAAGDIARVSVDSSGARVPGSSMAPFVSADGELVAFSSDGDLTASGATERGAFLRHSSTGALTRVGDGTVVGLSADGATLAVADVDQLGFHVYDLVAGTNAAYPIPNAYGDQVLAYGASLSSNGQHLIYARTGNGNQHLYVRDLPGGAESQIADPGVNWGWPTISDDGQTIAFQPALTSHPVMVIDRQSGATRFDPTGGSAGSYSLPWISPDGAKVLYRSSPTGFGGPPSHVYVGTIASGASVDLTPNEAGDASVGSWDPTGRYVSLTTSEPLVGADTNGNRDVYIVDTTTGQASLASIGATGTLGDNDSGFVPGLQGYGASSLAAGASSIAFASIAANLVADDGTGIPEVSSGPFGPVARTDVYVASPVLAAPPPPAPVVHISQVEQRNVNQPGTVDTTPAATSLGGTTNWTFNFHNGGTSPLTSATITADSGRSPATFSRFGPTGSTPIGSFPVTSTQASLPPNSDQNLTIGSSTPVSTASGFDSVRSTTPANVPAGGGQQTVSISLTVRDPAITNLFAYLMPNLAGEALVTATPPGNLDQNEVLGVPPVPGSLKTWSLLGAVPDKTYTFTAVVQVPNSAAASIPHKDRLDVYSQVVSPATCVPTCGPSAAVAIAEPGLDGTSPGSGRGSYSFAEPVAWQPVRILSSGIHYAGIAPSAPPPGNVIAIEAEQQRVDLPATVDAGPPALDPVSGTKAWAAVANNSSGSTITPSFRIDSGYAPAGFSIEDPLVPFGHLTPVGSFPVQATVAAAPTGTTASALLLASQLPATFTPGFDATRSSSPSTVPIGGTQQTTTVAVTARNASATSLNGTIAGAGAGVLTVAAPSNLDEGETFTRSTNASAPDTVSWSLSGAKVGKTYVVGATLQVDNPFGVPFPYTPQVSVGASQNAFPACIPSCGPSTSMAFTDPSLDGTTPGTGRLTFTSSSSVRWTALHTTVRTVRLFGTVPSQLVDVQPTTAVVGQPVALSVHLGRDGAPAAGKPVTLSLGIQSCAATTDAAGSATCTVTAPSGTGPAPVVARFAGDRDLLPSSATATVAVDDPPVVTSFTPTRGTTGTIVTISGVRLDTVTQVLFGGALGTIVSVTPTRLRASVPVDASSGPITLVTARASVDTSQAFLVQPRITAFSPGSGKPGDEVVVTGSNFTGTTSVKFGGVVATFSVDGDGAITATVPASAKTGPITVTSAAGTGTSDEAFLVAPKINAFSPNHGAVGTVVTISGINLSDASEVRFGGVAAAFTVSGTTLVAVVPAGATSGLLSVTNSAGTGLSTAGFKVVPVLTSFSPGVGAPGDQVTLTGSSLTGAASVKFGGIAATSFTVDDDGQITAVVPAGAKSGPITVTTVGGTTSNAEAFVVAPVITSFSPTAGTTGTVVTVNGLNLDSATDVRVGGLAAAFGIVSPTKLTLTLPAGALTGTISVTNPAGTATAAKAITVAPRITGFTPGSATAGSAVTISGDNLAGATSVSFGTVRATFTMSPSGSLVATVPTTARPGSLTVCNAAGCDTSAATFAPVPVITSFTPISAKVGATVTIYGTNLGTTTQVTFNGIGATPTTVTDTQVKFVIPAGASTGHLGLTTAGGTTTSAGTLTVT